MDNFVMNGDLARALDDYCWMGGRKPLRELLEDFFNGEYEDKDSEYHYANYKVLEPYLDWELEVESGDHVHDSDNADYTFTLTNPETGDYFIGGDNHNLCCGWNDVSMSFVKYDKTKDMVEVSIAELEEIYELCDAWDMDDFIYLKDAVVTLCRKLLEK